MFGLGELSRAGNAHQSFALDASHSSTVSMSSTSISCPKPMPLPSHWLPASCCSCLWVSSPNPGQRV